MKLTAVSWTLKQTVWFVELWTQKETVWLLEG